MKTYYTKTEDGSFHPATLNNETLFDLLGQIVQDRILSAINHAIDEKIDEAFDGNALSEKIQTIVDGVDLTAKVDEAIDDIDIEDMVRDEVQSKIENIDISVDVSI